MALARLKSIEALRYCAPGEWGKLLGLDRIPEVRTLRAKSKHLIDTIKMIAYRAETAMALTLREKMARYDDARSLLRALYSTDADLCPTSRRRRSLSACICSPTTAPMQSYGICVPSSTRPRRSFQAPICALSTNRSHRRILEIRRSELSPVV